MTDTTPQPLDLDADQLAVLEMGGCVLPTAVGMRAALEWLAVQEGVRPDWYAEEVPTILAGIDASRRLLAAYEALRTERDRLAADRERAPHARWCTITRFYVGSGKRLDCNCWKSAAPPDALAEVKRDAAIDAALDDGVNLLKDGPA